MEETGMHFGVFTSLTGTTWPAVLDLWRHLDQTGWDLACVSDHFMPNTREREGPVLEAWSTLSALAAVVPRMRIGTIVLGNTYRHPAVVAKMAAQVDIISGGRLLLGLGAAWQYNEHDAYGIPFYQRASGSSGWTRHAKSSGCCGLRPAAISAAVTTGSPTRRSIPSRSRSRIRN